jgi:hypothetical protein
MEAILGMCLKLAKGPPQHVHPAERDVAGKPGTHVASSNGMLGFFTNRSSSALPFREV